MRSRRIARALRTEDEQLVARLRCIYAESWNGVVLEPSRSGFEYMGHGKTQWHQHGQVLEQDVFGNMVAQDMFAPRHVRLAIRNPTSQPAEKEDRQTPTYAICSYVFHNPSMCAPASLCPEHPRELLRDSLEYPPVRRILDFVENFLVVCWLELGLHDSVAELVLWFSSVPARLSKGEPREANLFRILVVEQRKQRAGLAQLLGCCGGLHAPGEDFLELNVWSKDILGPALQRALDGRETLRIGSQYLGRFEKQVSSGIGGVPSLLIQTCCRRSRSQTR